MLSFLIKINKFCENFGLKNQVRITTVQKFKTVLNLKVGAWYDTVFKIINVREMTLRLFFKKINKIFKKYIMILRLKNCYSQYGGGFKI